LLWIFWGVSGKSEAIRTDHIMAVWSFELANNRNQKGNKIEIYCGVMQKSPAKIELRKLHPFSLSLLLVFNQPLYIYNFQSSI
jgi:hypothetical protein